MTEINERVAALEVWRANHDEAIRDMKGAVDRVETNVNRLLSRDSKREGRAALLAGLWPAVWLTLGTVAAAYLHIGGAH